MQGAGGVDRDVAHRDGLWHATAHVWVLDVDGRVLFQQRSFDKAAYPGWWDGSCAGHIREEADVFRELAEELGVAVAPGELVGPWLVEIVDVNAVQRNFEHARVYRWASGRRVDEFVFADGEVCALAAVPVVAARRWFAGEWVSVEVFRPGLGCRVEVLSPGQLVDVGVSFAAAFGPDAGVLAGGR